MNEPQGYSGTYGSIATTAGTYTATLTVADNATPGHPNPSSKSAEPKMGSALCLIRNAL